MTVDAWRIGQLAHRAGVSSDALRYYERIGLLDPSRRTNGNYRLYDRTALERVLFIRKAQALGLTLEETRDVLRVARTGASPCAHVRATLKRRIAEIDSRVAELTSLKHSLRKALARARAVPVARHCVCGIIESARTPKHVRQGRR